MKEVSIEISASMVAWYGAIVATLAIIINLLQLWRDRSRIVVKGRAGYKVTPGGPYDSTKSYILITVANHGRRSRTIDKVGVKLRSGKHRHFIAVDSTLKGPQELTEGRSCAYVMKQDDFDLENIEYVWAYDQTGKEFRGKLLRD